jgi:mono/diheme cytochrome c family protein
LYSSGCAVAAVLTGLVLLANAADPKPMAFPAEDVAFYEKEVLPLLKANCLKCHGGEAKVRGGLRLTSRDAVLKGGDLGPAFDPEKPAASRLLQAINYQEGLEMPPKGKMPQKDLDVLTRWVNRGLPWTPGQEEAVVKHEVGGKVTPESRNYWAYRPIRKPEAPVVKASNWVKNPIDAFVLAKLEAKGLTPAGPADRTSLIRRVTYDLTGLPPTPEEVDAFVADQTADAYEKLIDRLLASPAYGEKWGRHWLDVVRFAETNGYERDGQKPHAWRYRDYVIESFNSDKPFDKFAREQLAGDELPGRPAEGAIATGYYRLGIWDDEPADPLQARYDELDDVVATTAQVFLGMTMNCARCHDHKIDPIPQADYYRFVAFFQDVRRFDYNPDPRSAVAFTEISSAVRGPEDEAEHARKLDRLNEVREAMKKIEESGIVKMPAPDQRAAEGPDRPKVLKKLEAFLTPESWHEYGELRKQEKDLERQTQKPRELALSVNNCPREPEVTQILARGNPHNPGAKVEPGFPAVVASSEPAKLPSLPKEVTSSGRRTALADWITATDNPLTARVLANRVWQHHFGRGIVSTPNDFGKFGNAPTHPELLDWLASELVQGGWRLKPLHRTIMLSNAYRQSARGDESNLRLDPSNQLLGRFPMRRLTAEEVRDSVLAVSGRLNRKAGGPSVYPPIPAEVLAGQSVPGSGWGHSSPEESARRSIYVHVKRSLLVPILATHDQADTDSSCAARYTTTVPTQALGMLNGQFINEQAAALADRLAKEAPGDLTAQVRRAVRLTTARPATDAEVQRDSDYIRSMHKKGVSERDALVRYCLLELNANEFVYLD